MFNKNAIGVALNNGEDVVQLVCQGERYVPVGIGYVISTAIFATTRLNRRNRFFIR